MTDENFQILAQLIESMNEGVLKLEKARNIGNKEEYEKASKEILNFQKEISRILKKMGIK